jgi:hypothetical protein
MSAATLRQRAEPGAADKRQLLREAEEKELTEGQKCVNACTQCDSVYLTLPGSSSPTSPSSSSLTRSRKYILVLCVAWLRVWTGTFPNLVGSATCCGVHRNSRERIFPTCENRKLCGTRYVTPL